MGAFNHSVITTQKLFNSIHHS